MFSLIKMLPIKARILELAMIPLVKSFFISVSNIINTEIMIITVDRIAFLFILFLSLTSADSLE